MGRHEYVRRDDVLHVDEVAGLLAVAEDGQRLVRDRLRGEDRHRRRIGALRVLARPEHVEVAQARRFQLAGVVEHLAVIFAVELGDRVGALRLGKHRLHFRHDRVVAVDRRRGGKAELLHARPGRFLQHDQHAGIVDVDALDDLGHRFWHTDHRGEVEHVIHVLHRLGDGQPVADVALDEFDVEAVKVLFEAGTQAVQNPDLRLPLKILRNMAADEAGAAGDEYAHFTFSPPHGRNPSFPDNPAAPERFPPCRRCGSNPRRSSPPRCCNAPPAASTTRHICRGARR